MKNLLDYFDEHLDKYPKLDNMKKRPSYNTYPLLTLLNSMSLLGKPEYLTYKRDWLKEAELLVPVLPAPQRLSQGMYYLMALYNLGKLGQYVPDVREYVARVIKDWDEYAAATEMNVVEYEMHDTYVVELATFFGFQDLIPERVIKRMAETFLVYQKEDNIFNTAYGGAYALTSLGETGRYQILFQPNEKYEGQSPLIGPLDIFLKMAPLKLGIHYL